MGDISDISQVDKNKIKSSVGPTNEEIITEITKDIESCTIKDVKPDINDAHYVAGESINVSYDEVPQDFDHSSDEEADKGKYSTNRDADDFIDEDSMKDAELSYTDEDRERLRLDADSHKSRGNELFKTSEYQESAACYTLALRTCPLSFEMERSIMYCNRAAAKMKLSLTKTAIEDCTKAVELNPSYLKAYFRRAQLFEVENEKLDEALADYKKILELDPSHREALVACQKLPPQIELRNEKMKTEMIGKLKDLGNMILRPFGLSTNNFQLNPDPNGGSGYSINFQQNA